MLTTPTPTTTTGHLLGGRVRYRQPETGFRSGIEPVLLAAAIPARSGEHVLEAGTGAGAALLCLSVRVPGVQATGIEIDAGIAALAAGNAGDNGFDGIAIVTHAIESVVFDHVFDHAFANPPYHSPDGTASPLAARETAKRGSPPMMVVWIRRMSHALRDRGSLTLVVPAGLLPACLAAMAEAHCPCTHLFPLWPKLNQPAKLVLLRGVKRARTPMLLSSGIVLHHPDGSFTDEAEAILRDAAALNLSGR
jgi:tRNA1(Val) A37 N6-methylase TrmN6